MIAFFFYQPFLVLSLADSLPFFNDCFITADDCWLNMKLVVPLSVFFFNLKIMDSKKVFFCVLQQNITTFQFPSLVYILHYIVQSVMVCLHCSDFRYYRILKFRNSALAYKYKIKRQPNSYFVDYSHLCPSMHLE